MSPSFRQCLIIGASAIIFTIFGCGRRNEGVASPPKISWSALLKTNEPTIIYGPWEDSENAYAQVNKFVFTDSELKLWIGLQVEILEKTSSDPNKGELRLEAVQQMCNFPNATRPYLAWLKSGLATNRFDEVKVKEKAEEAVNQIENAKTK